jgi:membrane protease YdiL (CAAX protease family)
MPFTFTIFGVILLYVWILEPRLPGAFVSVPVALVIALGFWRTIRSGEWGLNPGAVMSGVRATGLFTAPVVVVVLACGAALGTLHDRGDFLVNFAGLVVWGAAQQWILQTVVLREAQRATSRTAGVIVAAALFAVLHLPNPLLATVTFIGALGWCAIYDRHPNIVPLAFSHATATMAILYAFDDRITGRLRIGYSYLMLNRGS